MWLIWILVKLSGGDLTPSATPSARALHIQTVPGPRGTAVRTRVTGLLAPRAEAAGKRQDCFPMEHLLRGEMMAGRPAQQRHAWPGLVASSCRVHGLAPGHSHPTAVYPLHPWELCWKTLTGIYFTLLPGREKRKMQFYPSANITPPISILFLYSTRKVKIGNRYVHRKK